LHTPWLCRSTPSANTDGGSSDKEVVNGSHGTSNPDPAGRFASSSENEHDDIKYLVLTPATIADIENLIRQQVQENIHLDYKDSRAINHKGRDDVSKDVSAFANSDGGVLIYGVQEQEHLPTAIDDGVDDAQYPREWIESAILNDISPRLDEVSILPIPRKPGRSLYVIAVGKSFRGPHQAVDKRY
jgi:hypothetical protein